MKVGPSEPACRCRLQTNPERLWSKATVVSVGEKAHVMRQVWTKKVSDKRTNGGVEKVLQGMSKLGSRFCCAGSSRGQQGLRTTCKDSSNEAQRRRRREPKGEWHMSPYERGLGRNVPRRDGNHVSPMAVTPTLGKGALDTWRFPRQPRGRLQLAWVTSGIEVA